MKKIILTILLVLIVPAFASAEVMKHAKAGVSIWMPDDWQKMAEDDMLEISSPDEEVFLMIGVLEASELEAALEEAEKEIEKVVTDIKEEGEPEEVEINGMPAVLSDAKGKVEGVDIELGAAIIKTPKNKVLLIIGIGTPKGTETHGESIEKIIGSVKPLK